jgi:hypothetical protein
LPQAATPPPARERTSYDARPQTPPVSAGLGASGFALRKETQVRVKFPQNGHVRHRPLRRCHRIRSPCGRARRLGRGHRQGRQGYRRGSRC